MANSKEIEILVPQLPATPGWVALSGAERDWLQEHTSNALSAFRESGLKAIVCCVELASVQTFLDGKSMTFTNWVRSSFGSSERTAYRWLASYKEMRGAAPDEAILYLAQEGLAGVNNTLQPKELIPVLKALPPPKSADKRALEPWRQKVSEALRSRRSARRKKVSLTLDQEDALLSLVLTGRRVMREAGLSHSAEQRAFLKKAMGYLMELRAISGSMTVERTPLPDGFLPKVGRPRKKPNGRA